MAQDMVSVISLASTLGRRKQTVFKVLKRLRIEATYRKSMYSRGQLTAYITIGESALVKDQLRPRTKSRSMAEATDHGTFYLVLLEPDQDPGRFKVGFAVDLSERMRHLRCSAPFIRIVEAWPCRSLWEKTAIECVAAECTRIHTEVFRANDIESVRRRARAFFALMPSLQG